jgi:hypothetical protein
MGENLREKGRKGKGREGREGRGPAQSERLEETVGESPFISRVVMGKYNFGLSKFTTSGRLIGGSRPLIRSLSSLLDMRGTKPDEGKGANEGRGREEGDITPETD